MANSRLPQSDLPLAVPADWRLQQRQGHQRSRDGFKECTGRFLIRSPCGELAFPPPVTFPNLRSGSQPVEQSKGSPSFSKWRRSKHQRVVRTLRHSLIASTRRLFLLTGPHTSTALRPLLPSSGGPDQGPPRRGPFLSAVAKNTGASDSAVYGLPHSHLLFCSNRRSGSVSS